MGNSLYRGYTLISPGSNEDSRGIYNAAPVLKIENAKKRQRAFFASLEWRAKMSPILLSASIDTASLVRFHP